MVIVYIYTMESTDLINSKAQLCKAIAHEHSEGVTKGLRVYKIHRLHGACAYLFYTVYKIDSLTICHFDRQL